MGRLIIKSDVRKIQQNYVKFVANYFFKNTFNPNKEHAYAKALGIYNKMIQSLNGLANSISTTFSSFPNFYKGYPIHSFQSSKGSSVWYFAYIKNEKTGDVLVFDMRNQNQGKGQTFNRSLIERMVRNAIVENLRQYNINFRQI